MRRLLLVLTLAFVVLGASGCVTNFDRTGRDIVATVDSKEVIPEGQSGRTYRVWTTIDRSKGNPQPTDDGVFNLNDDLSQSGESSTMYGRLQVGKTYKLHVIGRRYASSWLISLWPNIVSVEEVSS